MAVVAATPLSAHAAAGPSGSPDTQLTVPDHGLVTSYSDGSKALIDRAGVASPTNTQAEAASSSDVAALALNHNTNLDPGSSRRITPPGGTTGTIKTTGHSYVKVPFLETSANYTNNSSAVSWLGSRPFNATSITHTDHWHNSGISISVSVSWPPGIGFSGSGGSASWTTTTKGTWKTTHSWDSVRFGGVITKIHYDVTGSFQFGSSYYATTGYSGHLV
jgi:hypothetical protein